MFLAPGLLLQNGKYLINMALGQRGFGITYEAEQVALNRRVAIKEFYMREFCDRDTATSHVTLGVSEGCKELVERFRGKFIREAQMIAGLNHRHIIKIYDIFEENGTAYYVMEYLEGGSLADIVKNNGPMSESKAIDYISQIGNALGYVHKKNILHLDIKPSNVLLDSEGAPILIDFGVSKHYDEEGGQTSTTPVGISKGYAPMEQYQQGSVSKFSPATDIYSLGATFYFLLSGETPPDASEVNEDGLPKINRSISTDVLSAIEKAMSPRRKDRPQDTEDFLYLLNNQKATESTIILAPVLNEGIPLLTSIDLAFTIEGCSFKMVFVKGGSFMMGAVDPKNCQSDEKPIHKVTISDFHIGETVVTQQLWAAVMGNHGTLIGYSTNDPVVNYSYGECKLFIEKLNEITGRLFRLPSEAEWEYAARGGEKSHGFIYSGSDYLNTVAIRKRVISPVKSLSPNELGLYDMSGNVYEWCDDWYATYEKVDQVNPKGPLVGKYRVARGGACNSPQNYCRVSFRNRFDPSTKSRTIGLRLAL